MWDRCPLHVVVAAGDALRRASRLSAAIQEHLHAGVDIEAADVFGKTPLILAAEVGNTDAVGCLLKSGASPMARTLDGWTALHLAAGNGHTEVVQQLLGIRDCNLNVPDSTGEVPLHWAARWGRLSVLHILLQSGCDMEAKDNDGRTPMHVAAEYGRTEVLQHLLNLGARAHPQDRCGRTPLYLAQLCMRLDAVTILSAQDLAQEGASSAVSRGNRTLAAKITCC